MRNIDLIKFEIQSLVETKGKLNFDLERLKRIKKLNDDEKDINVRMVLKELQETLEKLIRYETMLYERIEKIENVYVKEILRLRYIHSMKWEDIVERMGFSRNWVFELHKRGVKELTKDDELLE